MKTLIEESVKVIKDCCLSNGAIVAANPKKRYYPKQAKNYRYVWPRDGAYICVALNLIGIRDVQEKFFKWCIKAETKGLFYEKYFVNGKKARHNFQPDQTGTLLWAMHDFYKENKEDANKFKKAITKSADALCEIWSRDHFNVITQDLWEERYCFPDLKENFAYSLAACYRGLMCANELFPKKRWIKTANEMKKTLLKQKRYFSRSSGKLRDKEVDASLLGLVWPFDIVKAKDNKIKNTVKIMEQTIAKDYKVYRYANDRYDGWMHKKHQRKKGAGYWPLLNFWMAIYHIKAKDRQKASKYYNKILKDIKDNHIPEQIFNNSVQKGVKPLCWSHAMYIFANSMLRK